MGGGISFVLMPEANTAIYVFSGHGGVTIAAVLNTIQFNGH